MPRLTEQLHHPLSPSIASSPHLTSSFLLFFFFFLCLPDTAHPLTKHFSPLCFLSVVRPCCSARRHLRFAPPPASTSFPSSPPFLPFIVILTGQPMPLRCLRVHARVRVCCGRTAAIQRESEILFPKKSPTTCCGNR